MQTSLLNSKAELKSKLRRSLLREECSRYSARVVGPDEMQIFLSVKRVVPRELPLAPLSLFDLKRQGVFIFLQEVI